MFADHNNKNFHNIRSKISVIVTPIQYTVNFPIDLVGFLIDDFSSKNFLIKENATLKAEVSLLKSELKQQSILKYENKKLLALLKSSERLENKVSAAKILAVSLDPFVHQVILNMGKKNGVFVGQPVLDTHGVMGQIIEVGQLKSNVMLITDSKSAIPVQIKRNGIRAIVSGYSASNNLKLQNITNTMDVKVGDKLITSGLGQLYPFGFPVGTITSIKHKPSETFADITVKPAAHLDRSRLVLLIWTLQKKENI